MFDYFVMLTVFNTNMPCLRLWNTIWWPIFINFSNTVWTYTWNLNNGTNTFTKLWIYPLMITQNNSIPYSYIKVFCSKWVPSKLTIITSYSGFFMLHIIYVLNAIMTIGKLDIFLEFVLSVFLVRINDRIRLASFDKIIAWSSSFSWTCMNLKKIELSQINSGINMFSIANLSICLCIAFRLSTTYLQCPGDRNALSIII